MTSVLDTKSAPSVEGRIIRIRGLVQGVGFRPTVWRLARESGLSGDVWNDAEGVVIRAWGQSADLDHFLRDLKSRPPPLARVDAIEWIVSDGGPTNVGFNIVPSRKGEVHTGIVPDAAACQACLADVFDPADRHYGYPFTNCTHCGPRLSIVRSVPYDRANTSMGEFPLCPACRAEYEDPADRRFHAQPTACPICGPRVWLEGLGGTSLPRGLAETDPLKTARELLLGGAIIAIKGLGGFHLACDACNEEAVARLRSRKRRYAKPFALMARNLDLIREYCTITGEEERLVTSNAAPIVILPANGCSRAAASVAPGQKTLGFMLPYTPLHHLLFRDIDRPLVMTSGNLSEEPQCTENDEARHKLSPIADFGLFHDRDIVNRLDDSLSVVINGSPQFIRRARGYAPAPIKLPAGFELSEPLLALGGELKNTFCLLRDGEAILSQHVGDLEDAATSADYRKALSLYLAMFDHEPRTIAVDLHPEYLSTKLAKDWATERGCVIEQVQHHHAHIASCLADNGVPLGSRHVLGIALDGLGLGPDGTLWGGEFLAADYSNFERLAHFPAVAMPGGAQAIRQPWRSAFSHLDAAIGWERCRCDHPELELVRDLEPRPLGTLRAMMRKRINSPLSSSCGRLFDAAAAAVGICRETATYEGQAAIELEAIVDAHAFGKNEGYPIGIERQGANGPPAMSLAPMWAAILDDLRRDVPVGVIAARFHRGLANAIVEIVERVFAQHSGQLDRTIALSGGSFQNRLLSEALVPALRDRGFRVLTHRQVPVNDGGLSFGQAVIAAARSIRAQHGLRSEVTACA